MGLVINAETKRLLGKLHALGVVTSQKIISSAAPRELPEYRSDWRGRGKIVSKETVSCYFVFTGSDKAGLLASSL